MDVFSESGETQDYLQTKAALAKGLPSVSCLTQEKITGRTAGAIYLIRSHCQSHWTANDAGSRTGQSAGYDAQIGVDRQLTVHYDGSVNGRLKQVDAMYPDSYGTGTPSTSHWRLGYEFGNAEDGNLLTRLLRHPGGWRAHEKLGGFAPRLSDQRVNLLAGTNRMLAALAAGCRPMSSASLMPLRRFVEIRTPTSFTQVTQLIQLY